MYYAMAVAAYWATIQSRPKDKITLLVFTRQVELALFYDARLGVAATA